MLKPFKYAYKDLYKKINAFISSYHHAFFFFFLFAGAIMSRAIFQYIPSVDPLLPIIFLFGSKYGWRKGIFFGASSYYASNFLVWGGQGWWSIPMSIGAAGAGMLGAFFKRHRYIGIILATAWYEIIINLAWALLFGVHTLIFALPFIIVHFVSNLGFMKAANFLERFTR